jgi:hypothetical protein
MNDIDTICETITYCYLKHIFRVNLCWCKQCMATMWVLIVLVMDTSTTLQLIMIPSRVKTIIPKEQEDNITLQLMAGKKIEEEEVEEEILNHLRVNGRLTYAGFLLNQWASSNNHNVSMIDKAFLNSI